MTVETVYDESVGVITHMFQKIKLYYSHFVDGRNNQKSTMV